MNAKQINIAYWIVTVLAAAMMGLSAIFNMLSTPESVDLVVRHLGYPDYFLPLIGTGKLLGAVAILVPGFQRIKEWAYAGLAFDLLSAVYSFISVGDPVSTWLPLFVPLMLIGGSYLFYHKRLHILETKETSL